MSRPLEDYAFLSDTHTSALVSKDGSIDWLCLPRFDAPACFASLLGGPENGFWKLGPADGSHSTTRRYRPGTLVLETEYQTATGRVRVTDCMPHRHGNPTVVRRVQGLSGTVEMSTQFRIRFDYGRVIPWVNKIPGGVRAIAGPDGVHVFTPVPLVGRDLMTEATFRVSEGMNVPFTMSWFAPHTAPPVPLDAAATVEITTDWWQRWASACTNTGPFREAVVSSLVTLKGLIYEPTGGVVAAATTSVPEDLGGERNWDYRYTWLRDASMTMGALARNGFIPEAKAWRNWLLRAVAGDPSKLQIMYGIAGERRLPESTLEWLDGYENSAPVRIGNGAADQFQLDVYGEILDAASVARGHGMPVSTRAWALGKTAADFIAGAWTKPDEGIWETRGGRQHFVHSKVMAWVAMDRAATSANEIGETDDARRWRAKAEEIHADILTNGYDDDLGSFVQSYGSKKLDAALLQLLDVGFLPGDDPRMVGTVRAIQRELSDGPLVHRYSSGGADSFDDGLAGGEGSFLICSFWMVNALAAIGDLDAAQANFEALLDLRNDVGLLAEEFDARHGRMVGNFPQAFSHIGLISSADVLTAAQHRSS